MTRSDSVSYLRSEFDTFLLAPIGEDKNGMLLSVLSALARMDIDPWEEASKLAQLPVEVATRTLASLITALPGGPPARSDPETVATRLIALLPCQAGPAPRAGKDSVAAGAVGHSSVITYVIWYLIFMVLVMVGQSFRSGVPPAAQV